MITLDERRQLINIIEHLYDFTDGGPRARRLLLTQAGLLQYVTAVDLSGSANIVASDIVGRLITKGYLIPERPNYHALGALLSYLLTTGELSYEHARFLAYLIVRYSLVLDPTYIDDIRAQYSISDRPIQPLVPMQVQTPPTTLLKTETPPLNITLPDKQALERVINSEDNFLDINLLAGAIYSAQAVCQIENREGTNVEKKAIGTGFLIGPDLLLTNQHVVRDKKYLTEMVARFGYQIDANGVPLPGHKVCFRPDFYFSSDSSSLDYALLRLQEQPLTHIAVNHNANDLSYLDLVWQGKHRGYLLLAERFIKEQDRLNIIQHPNGKSMKVVLTQNYVIADMTETRVQYVADTMDGSSGSPVLNQNWEVVALHHSGEPYPPDAAKSVFKKAWKGQFRANEGIPVRAILKDFHAKGLNRFLPKN